MQCARALHKNLDDLPCLARERFSASNKVINKISRKVEDTCKQARARASTWAVVCRSFSSTTESFLLLLLMLPHLASAICIH